MSRVLILAAALAMVPLLAASAQEAALEVDAAVKLAVANNLSLKTGRITLGKAARARSCTIRLRRTSRRLVTMRVSSVRGSMKKISALCR